MRRNDWRMGDGRVSGHALAVWGGLFLSGILAGLGAAFALDRAGGGGFWARTLRRRGMP